jgi:hypothetical protein
MVDYLGDRLFASVVLGFLDDVIQIFRTGWQIATVIALVFVIGGTAVLLGAFVRWWRHDRYRPREEVRHVRAHLWPIEEDE